MDNEGRESPQVSAEWPIKQHRPIGKLIGGLVAITLGILFLLDHQGLIDIRTLWRLWPVVFLVVGIGKLFEQNSRDRVVGAGVMFLIGTGWLLVNFGYFHWGQVWPAALIIFGVLLLWQSLRGGGYRQHLSAGPFDSHAVFSSVQKNINDRDFSGGQAQTVFGNVELDLTHAEMQGDNANIDLNVVFGSVEIRVPETWKVDVRAGAVFGSCENKTRIPLPSANPKKLVVRGEIVFGGVEIKN
jgi:predicted membrane protein